MNLQTIVALITGIASLIPQIGQIWEASGGFAKISALLNTLTSPQLQSLEALGAQLFPKAAADIQKVLAAIHLGYPTATKWVQQALNAGEALGFVSFGAPLVVDGIIGPKTKAAIAALQTKLGVHVTDAVTEVEYSALNLLLEGKIPGK